MSTATLSRIPALDLSSSSLPASLLGVSTIIRVPEGASAAHTAYGLSRLAEIGSTVDGGPLAKRTRMAPPFRDCL